MVGKAFVPTAKYNAEKAKLQTVSTEYENFKQSKMTDEEKQAELIKSQLEENKKIKLQLNKMSAENIFSKNGFKEDDYKDILEKIVGEDSKITSDLAESICNSMLSQKKEIEKNITEKIAKSTPKPDAGEEDSGKTDVDNYKQLLQEATKRNDYIKMAYYTRLIQEKEMKK